MKKILIRYYGKLNFGDDLFVALLAKHFDDCKINLLVNPTFLAKHTSKNISVHPFSFFRAFIGKLKRILKKIPPLVQRIDKFYQKSLTKLANAHDAYVYIGGSIFMQKNTGTEINFQTEQTPNFDYTSTPQSTDHSFIIGANLGPIYSEQYCSDIKRKFMEYTHICLRDYSSYCLVEDISHVQYAPDVIFLASQPEITTDKENVVISVIDISRHSSDTAVISAYYHLLKEVVLKFTSLDIPVTLVSFCKSEGDEAAIDKLIGLLPDTKNVSTYFYNGNMEETLSLFSNASFIVASRFHSMILGISFGKPVFPVSYNCKTTNYLHDLGFHGNYATLSTLAKTTCDDVFYNYENHIITDCSLHKKYASNQFRALRTLIDSLS